MAGTVTTTEITHADVREIKFAWTSNAAGAADATTTHAYSGQVIGCIVIPATGASIPSDQFDVTLTDANNVDVLHGLGADLSNVSTTVLLDSLGAVSNSTLTLGVTNAGNAKSGTVIVHIM